MSTLDDTTKEYANRHECGLEEIVREEVSAQVQETVQDTNSALFRST
jgi:hypothetical protein